MHVSIGRQSIMIIPSLTSGGSEKLKDTGCILEN
jgi:hypothetical protein